MALNNSTLVSVVMPAYNAERFIEETIQSVVWQTYENWELIVVDDCSTDGTRSLVMQWADRDSRITLLPCRENGGVAKARNVGIAAAKGRWIALLDSDDLWMADKLEKQLKLAEETGAELIYCSYALMSPERETIFLVPEETDYEKTLVQSVISCSTVLMEKSIAQRYPFSSTYYHEDYILWLSILRDGHRARGCREVLAKYRLHPNSRASNKWNSARQRWVVYREYLHLPLFKSCKVFVRYTLAGLKKYKNSKWA